MISLTRWKSLLGAVRAVLTGPENARSRSTLLARAPSRVSGEWVEVVGETPASLVAMYADLLRQRGIPAVARDSGVGRGALGGAPTFLRLLVPAGCAAEARAAIDPQHRGPDGPTPNDALLMGPHAVDADQRQAADAKDGG
jgi:hypothetical protein